MFDTNWNPESFEGAIKEIKEIQIVRELDRDEWNIIFRRMKALFNKDEVEVSIELWNP